MAVSGVPKCMAFSREKCFMQVNNNYYLPALRRITRSPHFIGNQFNVTNAIVLDECLANKFQSRSLYVAKLCTSAIHMSIGPYTLSTAIPGLLHSRPVYVSTKPESTPSRLRVHFFQCG